MNKHQQQAQDFADSLRTIQAVEENIESNEQGMRDQYQHKSGLQSEQGSWMAVEDALLDVMQAGKLNPSSAMLEVDGASRQMQRQYQKQIETVEQTIDDLQDTIGILEKRLETLKIDGEPNPIKQYPVA